MTKRCLCCDGENAADAETCVYCGQGSWAADATPVDILAPADATPVDKRARKAASK